MEMVKNSPKDCYVVVQRTTMVILERLNQVLQMEGHIQSNSDRSQYNDLQGLLCATLQSVLRKVSLLTNGPRKVVTVLLFKHKLAFKCLTAHVLDSSTGKYR